MHKRFDFLLFVDRSYKEFFRYEFYSLMPSDVKLEHISNGIYLVRKLELDYLDNLSRLGSLRDLGLIIDGLDQQLLRFLFQKFRSSIGYFIPYTYLIKNKQKAPSHAIDALLEALSRIIPRPAVSYKYPQLIFDYLTLPDNHYLIAHLPTARDLFLNRDPQYRPFSPPTSLPAILTRVLINLAQVFPKTTFLDPFCGTGTLAIDASIVGATSYCIDKNEKVLLGAHLLAEYYKSRIRIMVGDARNLFMFGDNSIDAIATDPPYGIGSPTFGVNLRKLYYEFLMEAYRILKNKRILVTCHIPKIPINSFASEIGFDILYQINMKVHSRLVRVITGLIKP